LPSLNRKLYFMISLSHNELSPEDLGNLPQRPGCYVFKSSAGLKNRVLYVGKAKNLRSRVAQYFRSEGDGRFFVQFIRDQTDVIEFFSTQDENDALILENELIKKYRPKYNIHLKDDKRYLSLRLDLDHEWPRIEVVRKIKKDRAVYLGPFSSSTRLKETLNVMQKIFLLRSCQDSKLYNRSRPCIEYDIKRCIAPCVGYCSKKDYQAVVESAVLFLRGKTEDLMASLENQMQMASEREQYEEAARFRDQIRSIQEITKQSPGLINLKNVKAGLDADVFGIKKEGDWAVVFILFVRGGIIWDQRSFEVIAQDLDEEEVGIQAISQYYSSEVYLPQEVYISVDVESARAPASVPLLKPRSLEKLNFISMAKENAEIRLKSLIEKKSKASLVLESLQAKLQLREIPITMDCLDISHHQGLEVVASVVRFEDAIPNKKFYRKIRLHHQKIDDFASVEETMRRRYKSEKDLPNLIIIDGGRGQLSAAAEVLKSMVWLEKTEVIALAKARDSAERIDPLNPMNRERVFKLGQKNPILLKQASEEELLLSYIRNEAHRFAIQFHRERKDKTMSLSILDGVIGLTAKNKLRLLREFGSIESIRDSSDFDLLKILKPKVLEALRGEIEHQRKSQDDSKRDRD